MITYPSKIGDEVVDIHALDEGDDEKPFIDFVRSRQVLALDVETTGLDIFADGFVVRLAQFSDGQTAWVLRGDAHADLIEYAIHVTPALIVHNATFDLAALERALGVRIEQTLTYAKTLDTAILSRIVDPLGSPVRKSGKVIPRHGLKELARKHLDPSLDIDKALSARLRRLGLPPKSKGGYAAIEVCDPGYVVYAGMDAAITYRLASALMPKLTQPQARLLDYETRVALLTTRMTRRGVLVDVPHTQAMIERLRERWNQRFETVAAHGLTCTDLNTRDQRHRFAQILAGHGVTLGKTKTGQPALSKAELEAAAAGTGAGDLVAAFFACREIEHHARDYSAKFLAMRDAQDRLHPSIHPMGAQTGRMSISDPPLQQLPRTGDVRGCLIAEEGHVLVAADYQQIEFRVAAALAGDVAMTKAIADGIDLHAVTAARLFGDEFTDEQREVAKRAGFGRLYGAGPATVARQCGVDIHTAERAQDAFDAAYPGILAFATDTTRRAELVTPTGRRLPTDEARSHIAINYIVQSTARDVFASALLRLADAGLADHLWLPIHDEIIVSVPEADAAQAAHVMEAEMFTELDGVPITAHAAILGRRWRKP